MPKYELPAQVDDLSELAANLHPLYVQTGGSGPFKFKDFSGIENALVAQKQANHELREKLESGSGLSAWVDGLGGREAVEQIVAQKDEYTRNKAALDGDNERFRNDVRENYAGKEKVLTGTIETLTGKLRDTVVSQVVSGAISAAGVNERGSKMLPDWIKPMITAELKDGEVILSIRDKDGKQRYDGEGNPMDAVGLVNSFRSEWPEFFRATGASGAGSGGSGNAESNDLPADRKPSTWTNEQRVAWQKKHGAQAMINLIAEEARAKGGAPSPSQV